MSDEARLLKTLQSIDGRSYPAYRDLRGQWDLSGFILIVDRVQGDPFAAPSRVRVRVRSDIPEEIRDNSDARIAAEDWLLRKFVGAMVSNRMGSGRSGEMRCLLPGPEVEERSAVRLDVDGTIEVRFQLGLPAKGRRVLGNEAWRLIDDFVRDAIRALNDLSGLDEHVQSVVFQRKLRREATRSGLVAFVANGAILPRSSGVDSSPLSSAIPFQSPPSLQVTLEVDGEVIEGMGVTPGVTVIVGGGFHGKSTLLNALERGHLDHVPGDGRERVVAHPDTVKIRAEDGRRVTSVDISAFLKDLPGGRSTASFTTDDASGSTSQAAAISEAIESGATVLLVDEDTSATNLLVRDALMRELISADREPITPFVQQVRGLHRDHGISTVIVVGGVGDYLRVADTVVGMNAFRPEDLKAKADALIGDGPVQEERMVLPAPRSLKRDSFSPGKVRARDERRIAYGREDIDLVGVDQILTADHAWSIGQAMAAMHDGMTNEHCSMAELLDRLEGWMDEDGLDSLSPTREPHGGLVRPRRHEVASALNRLRSLRARQRTQDVRKST